MHNISLSSYDGYKLNSHLTCFQRGFRAQLIERIAPVSRTSWVRIPLKPQKFFLGLLCNCLSCFTTAEDRFHLYRITCLYSLGNWSQKLPTHLSHISFPRIPGNSRTCIRHVRKKQRTFLHFCTLRWNTESAKNNNVSSCHWLWQMFNGWSLHISVVWDIVLISEYIVKTYATNYMLGRNCIRNKQCNTKKNCQKNYWTLRYSLLNFVSNTFFTLLAFGWQTILIKLYSRISSLVRHQHKQNAVW